jgi:hypothetical protein
MAQIMPEGYGLRQILVKPQCPAYRAPYLRHFEGMREARAKMIPLWGDEYLRLMRKAAERLGMEDTVAVALKFGAHFTRRLGPYPPTTYG